MFATLSFHIFLKGQKSLPDCVRIWALFCLHTTNDIRRSTPCAYCNGMHSPLRYGLSSGKWTPFFCPHAKIYLKIMSNVFEKQANGLIMVTTDQSMFPVKVRNGNVVVNLTAMAKPFGENKKPTKWFRYQEAQEYLEALSVVLNSPTADLVEVKQGGDPQMQGTWCYDYRIALRFAQWLSPEFSIIVDDIILNLLMGKTEIVPKKRQRKYPRNLEQFPELREKMRPYIGRKDILEIANTSSLTVNHVRQVLNGWSTSYQLFMTFYNRAKSNRKNGIRYDVDNMSAYRMGQLALCFEGEA